MKGLVFLIGMAFGALASFGQGSVLFANKIDNVVDAPVIDQGSQHGPGPYYVAQLFLTGQNGSLTPLLPTSPFQSAGEGADVIRDRYWSPVIVNVPGVAPGQSATFVVRAWASAFGSYEGTRAAGFGVSESAPFTVTLGDAASPANLTTLRSFAFVFVPLYPEPSTLALCSLGGALLIVFSRRRIS